MNFGQALEAVKNGAKAARAQDQPILWLGSVVHWPEQSIVTLNAILLGPCERS